ncbi:hypothetical protein Slin15195_G028600 [Septoria linicola]|uniref:Zn(2)-C6 fungal-type domain-containing protein n=1 Tax=Septoria linicola TaxID=215465 RepID=A0A9Q9ARP1_9PEZI|nr:hypothetical protein Slin14017_G027640 [Septoria linicola]USW49541.1 hypothetical protein Slin15195_G028600 [Septoria linicola]
MDQTFDTNGLADMPIKLPLAPASVSSVGDKMQRKRAARACDQCRRRKSRCDGQMNCSACRTIGLQCSFGHQVKQSRGPAYIALLEKKVKALEEKLRSTSYTSEHDTDGDESSTAQTSPTLSHSDPSSGELRERPSLTSRRSDPSTNTRPDPARRNDTMLSFDDTPVYIKTLTTEPRGKAFGNDILRQISNFCHQVSTSPGLLPCSSMKIVQALDDPQCIDSLGVASTCSPLLPAKQVALRTIEIALNEAFHLWPFIDRAQVERTIYRLYNTNSFGQEMGDKEELALVYAMLALGERFDSSTPAVAEARRMQGMQYFAAARELVPLHTCDRNLAAVQTILCLALFLKTASAPTHVHSYVAAATSAALRLGLHEDVPGFPKDESALRRRVWSAITVLDIYISTQLGVPRNAIIEDDNQNPYPPLSTGSNAELVASDAHLDMLRILSRVTARTYCSKITRKPSGVEACAVDQREIQEASDELEHWAQSCPVLLQAAENMTRAQLYLAYASDYAQLLLYSPFVHYLALPGVDRSSQPYALGLKAVNAALHAVQIAELLHSQLQYNEAYFLTIDVLVFAAMMLLVVEAGSADNALVLEAMRAGRACRELLLVLSLQSMTASQCWEALAVRSSNVAGHSDRPLNHGVSPTMPTSKRRAKAAGTISLPPSRPVMLRQEDSAIDIRQLNHLATDGYPQQYPYCSDMQTLSLDATMNPMGMRMQA